MNVMRRSQVDISRFSTLQRVEIAEILFAAIQTRYLAHVSVLFNESKLLKSASTAQDRNSTTSFSTLQRVEIAEMECAVAVQGTERRVSVLFNESKLLKSEKWDSMMFR